MFIVFYTETGDPAQLTAQLAGRWVQKTFEIVYGEENDILYWADYIEQPRQNKILLYRYDKPNEPSKKGRLLFESPFTSVLTVSRGHHSLVSLVIFMDEGSTG